MVYQAPEENWVELEFSYYLQKSKPDANHGGQVN
jgi:hypothetical protein